MKYLKVFENQAEESAWKESEEYIKTSLSMDKENMDELSYNSKVKFRAEYNLEGLEGDVKLMNCGNIFDSLKVNGIEAVTGSVETTREEVKCGVGGEKIYWELHIPSGVYDTDNMDWDANENLMMPKYAILNSDFEIELVGSYTEEDIMNGSVRLYEIDNGWTTLESEGFIFKNEGKTRFGISAMYTGEINSSYYGGALRVVPFFQLSGATDMYEEIIVRGSYLKGEDVVENITVTSSDLGLDDSSNLCVTNTDKYIGGRVKELYLSHDSTNTNLGILLSLIAPMSEPQCNGVLNLEEAVASGVVTQIDNNKCSVSSLYIGQFCGLYSSSWSFVNLDYVTDGLLTSADGLIPTTCEILKEDFDIYEYNREELKFTSATDMLSAQIVTNVNFNDIYSAYGLFSNIDSETNIIASYCYAIEIGGVRESLVTIGDGVYQFPQSWIDAAQEIFNSGGSVTFISTNFAYVIMMFDNLKPTFEDDLMRTMALDMYEMSYSIIQESMSGGAPKELSVDASVGRVSLIGEVNDYFSTLPSNGFEGCPLETVIIPDNVKSIGTKCFGHCDRLKKVYLPQNMDKLADYSFGGNSVKRGNVVNVRSVKDESPLVFGDYGGKVELYEWVDLGLPSGLKWAAWNVGATKPEEYGLYFAWGETQGYTGITDEKQFSFDDYKWLGADESNNNMTKYNATDNLTILEASDDAATATDNSCRMPTSAECAELTANTTSEWVDDYNGTGVHGRIFTSNVNGNSIFVPAAGQCNNVTGQASVGESCIVWTSQLAEYGEQDSGRYMGANFMLFDKNNLLVSNAFGLRYFGFSVRAVKE